MCRLSFEFSKKLFVQRSYVQSKRRGGSAEPECARWVFAWRRRKEAEAVAGNAR
jgi:hypothetical protein